MLNTERKKAEDIAIREELKAIVSSGNQVTIQNGHRYTNGVLLDPNQLPGVNECDALFVYKPNPTAYPSCSNTIYHHLLGTHNVEGFRKRKGSNGLIIIVKINRIPQIFPRDHDQYQKFLEQL